MQMSQCFPHAASECHQDWDMVDFQNWTSETDYNYKIS